MASHSRRLAGGSKKNPKDTTLRDLEEMYLRMVNIEELPHHMRVTTVGLSNIQNPYDIVIIDEIKQSYSSRNTTPTSSGRKAILVGDHRQLPPFKRIKSVEEMSAGELAAEGDSKYKTYENMVTSALFAEYFKEADPTFVTLRVQYRMHEDVYVARMNSMEVNSNADYPSKNNSSRSNMVFR